MRSFLIAFAAEFFSYFIIVCNTRAFTQGSYKWTLITDGLFITQSFYVMKWMTEVKEARGTAAYIGFLLGGTLGSLSAIFVTKNLYGG